MYFSRCLQIMVAILLLGFSLNVDTARAHCQIPCGIFTDDLRFKMLEEDITTIEKSMNQIVELSKENPVNYNQLVRWIINKEDHANKIFEIVNEYFLAQRIKLVETSDQKAYQEYTRKLALLHQILVHAMKAKQSTDLANVEKLRSLVKQFHEAYFGPQEKEHLKDHH